MTAAEASSIVLWMLFSSSFSKNLAIRTSFLSEFVFFVRFMGAFSHDLMMSFVVVLLVDVVEGGNDWGGVIFLPDIGWIMSGEERHLISRSCGT